MSTALTQWKTNDVKPSKSDVPWKKSMGIACPHGKEFFMVDGSFIRNEYDSDFIQGGNGYRYRFCPKGELWIDECTPEDEIPFVAFHECFEVSLMAQGMGYEQAHDRAKRMENKFRRIHRPGEGRR